MIEIKPLEGLDVELDIPGSKYIANRVLVIAALANGKSIIKNLPDNEDINQSISVLKEFGVIIEKTKDSVIINGTNGLLKQPKKEINVGESGTLMRFITGFASLVNGTTKITGSNRIKERPISDLLNCLEDFGVKIKSNNGFFPIEVKGNGLEGGKTKIKGNVSSQFISSLLMISPFAKQDVEIIITSKLLSKKYVDMTIKLMKKFGVNVQRNGYKKFKVLSGQRYKTNEYVIPADWCSASYFFSAAAIIPGSVKINELDFISLQGESKFPELLVKMGCMYRRNSKWLQIIGMDELSPIEIDMSDMPDVVPNLAIIAAFCKGNTKITNISHLRLKESDRISAVASELNKLGIKTIENKDSLTIFGGNPKGNVEIETYNDHRIAMSFAIAGLKLPGIKIKNPDCVNKSFPGFWDKLKEIGAEIKDV